MKAEPHTAACAVRRGAILYDIYGKIRVMAVADNYCMVRRPHCVPFIITVQEAIFRLEAWNRINAEAEKKKASKE